MRLLELFSEPPLGITKRLRQAVLDLLTPLAANKVPFVTVQQVIDELRETKPGLFVDRSLVMDLLNPDEAKIVSKIEGDRVYLSIPDPPARDVPEDDEEREKERIRDKAVKKAKKDIRN